MIETDATRRNMLERLDSAERHLERLRHATDQKDVQDFFWACMDSLRATWFYFGRWLELNGLGGKGGQLVDDWKDDRSRGVDHWTFDVLATLRNNNTHVEPVMAKSETRGMLMARGGKLLARDGKLMVKQVRYWAVDTGGRKHDVTGLAEAAIRVYRRFAAEFDQMPEAYLPKTPSLQ